MELTVTLNHDAAIDQWVAHVLDLDVVTQGHSPDHAFAMAHEAAQMVLESDAARGLDPFDRRAPPEDWAALQEATEVRRMTST